jgi:vacuolar iron transporter family protein
VPLGPFILPVFPMNRFASSVALTLAAMFAVGASRGLIANVRWWKAGLEMLGLGAVVATLAYASGRIVAAVVAG